MIKTGVTVTGDKQAVQALTRNVSSYPQHGRMAMWKILNMGQGILQGRAPVFSGDLQRRGIMLRTVGFRNVHRGYIDFPMPYTWFAEYGRKPSVPKKPNGWLRWWNTPPQMTMNPDKRFAKYSPRAKGSLFIFHSALALRNYINPVYSEQIRLWLGR